MSRIALALGLLMPALASAQGSLPANRVVERDGLVRLAAGVRSTATGADPARAARLFAETHAAPLGLRGSTLGTPRLLSARAGSIVRFEPTFAGLPIVDFQVALALDASNRVRRVASSARPIFGHDTSRRLSGRNAIARAAEGLDGVLLRDGRPEGAFREVIYVENGIARLAYEVHVATLSPLENVYALVDASSGRLLSRRNRIFFSDDAKVWQANPGASETSPLVTQSLSELLPPLEQRDPEGHLVGSLLDAFSCCAHLGCDPAADRSTINGTISMGMYSIPFTAEWCELHARASNLLEGRTDYDYSVPDPLSFDPPSGDTSSIGDQPADTDLFAEVHGFYHANRAYQFFRALDPSFVLRDAQRDPARKTQVWANYLMPDSTRMEQSFTGIFVPLGRLDNAAFMPRETWASLPLQTSATLPDTDAIVLFQGTMADSAYDGEVIYHEMTHGVVYSTANFNGPHLDQYGALDEGGSLHEGFADFFAGAMSGDPMTAEWFGALVSGGSGLRSLDNDYKCPDLLIGEVHNDSMHFSGATWALRQRYLGSDEGHTFDLAVFDAVKSLVSGSGFEETATAIADEVAAAFSDPAAAEAVLAEYRARGVIECIKVLETSEPREYYLPGTSYGYSPFAPGPIQLERTVADGAQSLTVSAMTTVDSTGLGGTPQARALVSIGQPITFTGTPGSFVNDAQLQVALSAQPVGADKMSLSAEIPLTAPRGAAIYVSIGNWSQNALALTDLTLSTEPLPPEPDAGQPEPDAGETDAGETEPDAGQPPDAGAQVADAGTPAPTDAGSAATATADEDEGCGCASATAAPSLLMPLVAGLALMRRRRRG